MAAVEGIGRASDDVGNATHDLYRRYGKQIYAYCLHKLRSREEAEDAVQTTFMNAFRSLQRGNTAEFEQAWLFKIAQNVCHARASSSIRRLKLETPNDFEVLQEIVPAQDGGDDSLELIGVEEALERMPENQRRAILLREWQGLSYREIAAELDVTQTAVEMLIFRARRTLAGALEQPPEKKTRVARLAGAFGSLAGALKTLLTGGAAIKAAAVAAGAVAVVGQGASHTIVRRDAPAPKPKPAPAGAPVAAHNSPAAGAAAVVAAATVSVQAPVGRAPVSRAAKVVRRDAPAARRRAPAPEPLEPVTPVAPTVAAPPPPVAPPEPPHPAPAPAPAPPPPAAPPEATGKEKEKATEKEKPEPVAPNVPIVPAVPVVPAVPATPPPADARGHGKEKQEKDSAKLQEPPPAETPPVVTEPAPAPVLPEPPASGNGDGRGKEKKADEPTDEGQPPAADRPGNGNGNGNGNGKGRSKNR